MRTAGDHPRKAVWPLAHGKCPVCAITGDTVVTIIIKVFLDPASLVETALITGHGAVPVSRKLRRPEGEVAAHGLYTDVRTSFQNDLS